jgi:hypothetical protein
MTKTCESAIEEHLEGLLSDRSKQLRRWLNNDLYNGPLYLDKDGESTIWCDPEGTPFDFSGALTEFRNLLDDELPSQFYYDEDGDVYKRDPTEDKDNWETIECDHCEDDAAFERENRYYCQVHAPDDSEELSEEQVHTYIGPQPYYYMEYRDIRRVVCGSELASML